MTQDISSNTTSGQWHSIRPWTSRLLLSVRDITSVSVTFVLTSAMDPPGGQDLSVDLAVLGVNLEDPELSMYTNGNPNGGEESSIPDLLGRELAVKVDKIPWQNVLVDVSDEGEEAIIVLYGLMPGRHYEVELTVVNAKEPPLRKSVVTDVDSDVSVDEHTTDPEPLTTDSAAPKTTVSLPLPSSHTHPLPSTHTHSSPPPRQISIEERAVQLRHNLSLLQSERDSLSTQLKTARKDSQRMESSLRAEMDALKRASEKQSSNEMRTRQKVLALQEAVKQALAAADDAEEEERSVAKELEWMEGSDENEEGLTHIEKQHESIRQEAKQSSIQADSVISASQKRITELQNELSALTHRLDRLNVKKDRLESETLPEMETELNALRNIYTDLEKGDVSNDLPREREESSLATVPQQASLPSGSGSSSSHGGKARLQPIGRPSPAHSHSSHPPITLSSTSTANTIGSNLSGSNPSTNTNTTATSPRPQNQNKSQLPRRPGILNVQHILQRTPHQ